MRLAIIATAAAFLALTTGAVRGQTLRSAEGLSGPRLIDSGRLDQASPKSPQTEIEIPKEPVPAAPSDLADRGFVLTNVEVRGAVSLSRDKLVPIWERQRGQLISVRDLYAIADKIAAAYAKAGFALYRVSVPRQGFSDGPALIDVTEGYVDAVAIEGVPTDSDLPLLKAYAAKIIADRPLRQATLERYLLLMDQIPGIKVGSRLEPINGRPGAVRLRLGVQKKTWEYGLGFNNQGASALSRLQLDANVALNSLFSQGDRTQVVVGAPLQIDRYQYYGVNHLQPIGQDGATVTLSLGDLVTHPSGSGISGNALMGSIQTTYPVILASRENLLATGSFDFLNSNNAILGRTVSDERTRAVRLGLAYGLEDRWSGTNTASGVLSQGIDAVGAKRGGPENGGPAFTKINLRLGREQDLSARYVIRVKSAVQYTQDHLPSTEQFAYGGLDFGRGFDQAALLGDQAIAFAAETAYRLSEKAQPTWLDKSEIFVSGDWARAWNLDTNFQLRNDSGASLALGARTRFLRNILLELGAARVLQQPRAIDGKPGWRFIALVKKSF